MEDNISPNLLMMTADIVAAFNHFIGQGLSG
jgi:hypothetical protein